MRGTGGSAHPCATAQGIRLRWNKKRRSAGKLSAVEYEHQKNGHERR